MAGISIATLTGENGILNKANTAKQETTKQAAKEKIQLAMTEYQVEMKKVTIYSVLNKIEGMQSIEPDSEQAGLPYTVIVDGYEFLITDESGKIEIIYQGPAEGILPEITKIEKNIINEEQAQIMIEATTKDKGGIEKIVLIKDGVEIDTKTVEGNEITDKFIVTGNGTYQIKVVGKNKRRTFSQKIVITELIKISGTIRAGSVIEGNVMLTITGDIKGGNISKLEIYDGQNKVKEIIYQEEKTQFEEQVQIENIPFYEEKIYSAKIVASSNETVSTNVVSVKNTDIIKTKEDLKKLSSIVNEGDNLEGKNIKLANDIDMQKENFIPIGNEYNPFNGRFNGQFHVISNLYIREGSLEYSGFFGFINEGATVENLILDNADIHFTIENSFSYVGIICGQNSGTVNCVGVNEGEVYTEAYDETAHVGGICGWNNGIIKNSYNKAFVHGKSSVLVAAGGIVGFSRLRR